MTIWIKKLLFFTFSAFLFVIFLNYAVDPYDKFGFNLFGVKHKALSNLTDTKFYYIDKTDVKYDIFMIGSSRTQRFQSPEVEKLTGLKTYNYAVNTAKPEDYLAILRHIFAKQNPKEILLNFDFFMLNSLPMRARAKRSKLYEYLNENVTEEKEGLFYKGYLGFDAFKSSYRVLIKNFLKKEKPEHDELGGHLIEVEPPKAVRLMDGYFDIQYVDYKFSNERIEYLKEVKKLIKKHNAKLHVSISPVNEEHYKLIMKDEKLKATFFEFKKIINQMFENVHDFNNEFGFKGTGYWIDSVHPHENLTKEMIKVIFTR